MRNLYLSWALAASLALAYQGFLHSHLPKYDHIPVLG